MLFKRKKIKKRLMDAVIEAIYSCLPEYEKEIEAAMRNAITEDGFDEALLSDEIVGSIRDHYAEKVEAAANNWYISLDPPEIRSFGMMAPPNSSQGRLRNATIYFSEDDPEYFNTPRMAGRVYNLLHYAEFGEEADPADCVAFNHGQFNAMQEAVARVQEKFEKEFG